MRTGPDRTRMGTGGRTRMWIFNSIMDYSFTGPVSILITHYIPLTGSPAILTPSLLRKAIAFSMFALRADEDDGFLLTNGISALAMK